MNNFVGSELSVIEIIFFLCIKFDIKNGNIVGNVACKGEISKE